MKLTIATRKSPLALWQTEFVAAELRRLDPTLDVRLLPLSTRGDEVLDRSLAKIGGKGLFLKELETALLDGRADLAVHSMKDVPVDLPPGLSIVAVMARHDPRDVLVARQGSATLAELAQGARVGTSSLRRRVQLAQARPDLDIADVRGNIHTRLKRLDDGEYDALVLAAAGLERMAIERGEILDPDVCLPAVAQGAIGIECASDSTHQALFDQLNCATTWREVATERRVSRALGGSCQTPLAVHACCDASGALQLRARVGALAPLAVVGAEQSGPRGDWRAIADRTVAQLRDAGAERLLAAAC